MTIPNTPPLHMGLSVEHFLRKRPICSKVPRSFFPFDIESGANRTPVKQVMLREKELLRNTGIPFPQLTLEVKYGN